ncbi:phospho-N-acetylmuramoyl-pentapeptide-transferase [Anaerovorax odorimutans]|uniref:phospho-N-acetylmuramoyl-pentapeptide- transferase n=1 Tax=Anaerovorax odorimutans TaxID=109327 RepID=UPI0004203F4E|nr:phospho-N-acetylmuramoyl-pentapeptide-transferase [Anaerovorax odorimutans]
MNYTQMGITIAVAFIITVIGMLLFLPVLKKIKAGQSIREEGPKSHMIKSGTPTMGGIVIIAAVFITCITAGEIKKDMIIILAAFVAFGILGFLDDFVKVSLKRNLGLTAKQKLFFQILIAVGLAIYQSKVSIYETTVFIPFINQHWDFGLLYIPFVAFVVVAMVNSVNLTDGLDGLASGVSAIVSIFLAIYALTFGFPTEITFCSALAGGCIGFLMFNKYPAKVFMGDTGSLALGGGIASAAILMNIELIIPIAGGVFLAETLSVIIQVISFKTTGKRVFKMAPLHHHFELCGFKETTVVAVFWLVTLILCVISMLII